MNGAAVVPWWGCRHDCGGLVLFHTCPHRYLILMRRNSLTARSVTFCELANLCTHVRCQSPAAPY